MNNKIMKIVLFGDPVLRQTAKPVTIFHKKLHSLIDDIAFTLENMDDGAALAANQVGVLKRIIVIDYQDEYIEMINPEIIEASGEQTDMEGCLSYLGYFGRVTRAETVKVKFMDRNGNEVILKRSGKLARCFQHEIDHLDGVLFVDRMTEEYLVHSDDDERISLEDALAASNGK